MTLHERRSEDLGSPGFPVAGSSSSSAKDVWEKAKAQLRSEIGEDVFGSWFQRMELEGLEEGTVRVSVPTRFLKSWIQSHYTEKLLVCMQAQDDTVNRIEIVVRSAVLRSAVTKPEVPTSLKIDKQRILHVDSAHDALGGSELNPRLVFENFVVGGSNTLAHAAIKQIATWRKGDPVMFNPLFIHANVGRGKTHLLQAVAWAANCLGERKALYLTAEKFMYGFVKTLREGNPLAFKEKLRGIGVLVIDDLQFISGKATQAEFEQTLGELLDAGRQVVIAADRPPSEMESFNERARSRLGGGLVVEVGPLHEELRLEVLKMLVASARANHPAFEVTQPALDYIAKNVTHNGRDLEGAVNRLLAHSKLTMHMITMELVEREVRDLIRPQEGKRVKIEAIQNVVAKHYGVARTDLISSRRTANVVRPRQVAMYLAKVLTLRSLPEIGRHFGGRDHTTVLHAVRKIEHLVGADMALAEEVELLKKQLQQ